MRGIRLISVARFALVGMLVTGCGAIGGTTPSAPANGGGGRPAITVTVAKATTGPISQVIGYNGTVQASDSVNVSPVISGRVTKLNVDVGSNVKAGDLIAELDKTTLQAAVEQAQAGVDAANVKLAQIQAGARSETVDAAQANVVAAQAKLAAIQTGARPETVAEAKANLEAATAKLAAIQDGARPQNVASAKANLDLAIAKLNQLKDGPTSDQVAASQLAVNQAQDNLYAAQANRDGVCGNNKKGPSYQCVQQQAAVDASQTALNTAQQNLKILTDPPTKDALDQAQASVDAAQQAYLLAQQPYVSTDLQQAQAAVDAAQQAYDLAATPYLPTDVQQAQAAVQAAQDQAKLAAQPYTDLDVKAAQVAVQQAQAQLDSAKAQVAQADVYAPFDGVVTARFLSLGALATPSTPIVSIMSPHLEVQFSIDQSNITDVKAGDTVQLTTAAFPGKQFPASVTSVYPSADPKTHTFTVVVVPQDTTGQLRAGMFVTLNVTVQSFQSAILVPSVSIIQQGNESIVYVIANNQAHLTPVQTGVSDDTNTQILSGVKPGDQVATINQTNLSDGSPVRIANVGGGAAGGAGRPAASGTPTSSGGPGAGASAGGRPAAKPSPTKAG